MTQPDTALTPRIYDLLYRLGLRAVSTNFFYTAYAVRLTAECPTLLLDEQRIYWEVAALYRSAPEHVRAGIEQSAATVWTYHRTQFCAITHKNLHRPPTPVPFLTILAACLSDSSV